LLRERMTRMHCSDLYGRFAVGEGAFDMMMRWA
jgi:hypothetical protein